MQPDDLASLIDVSAPALSPDGRVAVVAATRPDLAADAYTGQLWSVGVDPAGAPGRPRRLTRGFRDTEPQFSPDGELLAFLRAGPDGPAQLYVVAAGGGEPVQVTDRALGVSEFTFAPDGGTLAFVSREPEPGRYGTVAGLTAAAEPARRITTLGYRQNGLGYDIDRRAQLFTVPVPDVGAEPVVQPAPGPDGPAEPAPTLARPRQVSAADADHHGVRFSPDGRTLAAIAAVHPERDIDRRTDILLFDLDGGVDADEPVQPRRLTAGGRPFGIASLEWAPDGPLYFLASELGDDGRDFVGRSHSLFTVDPSGGGIRRLTDPGQDDLGESCPTIRVRTDGSLLVTVGDHGSHQLLRVSAGGRVSRLTDGPVVVSGLAAGADPAGPVLVSYSHPRSFGDLARVESDGRLVDLTDFSAGLRERGLTVPEERRIRGRDGHPVHGWVAVPDREGPHPVLLMIHGGPFASYGPGLFDETQVLAAAGYAVAYCNPRGSRGYGERHGRSIRQQLGTVDLADVLDFLDGVVAADPRLDGTRTGILGGSYGGYLTAWATAHDRRWQAAVVERGFLDPEVFFGTSDIGAFFGVEYVGTDPERIRAQSPQAHAGEVSTPTLVLHSEDDLRCPLDQAQRYYATLRTHGVPAELVIFPGENHELSRSGRPRHRRQRFEILLDWFHRRLPVADH